MPCHSGFLLPGCYICTMAVLFKKEVSQFFSGATGYLSILLFLAINGLYLFIFPDSNIFSSGYASLQPLFDIAPWVFLLLIPALTMRLFSEEWREGTMELLLTVPLRTYQIIGGKYLSSLLLLVIALLPTLFYYATIHALAAIASDLDQGAIIGSYVGLFLLGSVFAAIGTWCSSLSKNTVVAFLLSLFFCFMLYAGFDALSRLPIFSGNLDYYLQLLGIQYHYQSISRGVLSLQDIFYFLSLIAFFIYLTKWTLDKRKWE